MILRSIGEAKRQHVWILIRSIINSQIAKQMEMEKSLILLILSINSADSANCLGVTRSPCLSERNYKPLHCWKSVLVNCRILVAVLPKRIAVPPKQVEW